MTTSSAEAWRFPSAEAERLSQPKLVEMLAASCALAAASVRRSEDRCSEFSCRSLRRPEDLFRFQQEPPVRPSVGSVRRPRFPRFVAAGLVPKMARSEDLSFSGAIAVDLVRRLPRSEERASSRAGSIASSDSRSGPEGLLLERLWTEVHPSRLRPRLWHKVEHVHPGALRGRAVGSAPDILGTPGTVPLLHFSLGFKDSGRLLAHRAQAHQGEPRWSQGRLAASLELFEPPSASSTSGPRPALLRSLRGGRSLPGAHSESPIPRGLPVPRYLARRTRALHSDPRVRVSSSSGPGFSPVARLACRVVLRSCFRPGTRLGLPRLPPLATSAPVQDRLGPGARPGWFRYKIGT